MSGPPGAARERGGAARVVDLLVVGLGPAGASAAAIASENGLTVLAVEKRRRVGEPVQCAELVPLPLARHARDAVVQTIDGMNTFLPSGARAYSRLPGLMIDRALFDRSIAQRAARAGARLATAVRLVGLDCREGRAALEGAEGIRTVEFRLLVAADGPRSTVATLLGLPALDVVATRQYTVSLAAPCRDTDIWLSDAFPGGYGWLFPKGPVANLGLGVSKRLQADLKTPLDALHESLIGAGRVTPRIVGRTGGAIPVSGLREPLVSGRVLFVGDAGGFTHPITGAGIAAAVTSGERAGRAACDFLQGREGRALEEFEEDMRDQFALSLARAVRRRAYLSGVWHTPQAARDGVMRRGWIAFPEYLRDDP